MDITINIPYIESNFTRRVPKELIDIDLNEINLTIKDFDNIKVFEGFEVLSVTEDEEYILLSLGNKLKK
ncbi:hypothetical protein [Clostridium brassicae]|uniref:Uncharacterized protein n=1 Tax=Clostridium brassicae TaxID=2999072 RepID=A0ABT4D6B9_9CLOT|nr:hypothetical protein [Clostridium brassicae]MCY6957851.1 hypothetical protein [Clostridium brassicae]